jgi:hypothetical protein
MVPDVMYWTGVEVAGVAGLAGLLVTAGSGIGVPLGVVDIIGMVPVAEEQSATGLYDASLCVPLPLCYCKARTLIASCLRVRIFMSIDICSDVVI